MERLSTPYSHPEAAWQVAGRLLSDELGESLTPHLDRAFPVIRAQVDSLGRIRTRTEFLLAESKRDAEMFRESAGRCPALQGRK
jgi:hypothetical protein